MVELQPPMLGEKPKTLEQEHQITALQFIIRQELTDLGVSRTVLPSARVHFLDPGIFSREISATYGGIYSMARNHVFVADTGNKSAVLVTTAEEMLHGTSYQQKGPPLRLGYNHGIGEENFFYGLDEAAINIMKRDMFVKNMPYLTHALDLSTQDQENLLYESTENTGYNQYVALLEKIVDHVSVVNQRERGDVVRELKRGPFQETPDFFTTIWNTYGSEGLSMLAHLGFMGIDTPLDNSVCAFFTCHEY